MIDKLKAKLIHWLGGYTKDDLAEHCDSIPIMGCILRSKIKKIEL